MSPYCWLHFQKSSTNYSCQCFICFYIFVIIHIAFPALISSLAGALLQHPQKWKENIDYSLNCSILSEFHFWTIRSWGIEHVFHKQGKIKLIFYVSTVSKPDFSNRQVIYHRKGYILSFNLVKFHGCITVSKNVIANSPGFIFLNYPVYDWISID